MSKVYSFRLDENNPREAQAREVIEAWASNGYSLRRIIVNALISYQSENSYASSMEDVLEKITRLFRSMKASEGSAKDMPDSLTDVFVGSLSKSMKSGMRME
jgi:hypothetical protein